MFGFKLRSKKFTAKLIVALAGGRTTYFTHTGDDEESVRNHFLKFEQWVVNQIEPTFEMPLTDYKAVFTRGGVIYYTLSFS